MASKQSLRQRILVAYLLLAFAVWGCLAAIACAALFSIENVLVNHRLERTADLLIDLRLRNVARDPPPSVTLYQDQAIPDPLRPLKPGRHELSVNGRGLHVLVRDAQGQRFVLTDDESEFEAIETTVYWLVAAALLASLGLAWLLGQMTASRVIAPVTALAHAVEQAPSEQPLPHLQSTDEIGVLARAFSARTEQLNRLLARERWFVGDVSHELRTPLTVILGAAEVLCTLAKDRHDLLPVAERIRRTAADSAARVGALLLLSRAPETVGAPRTALIPIIRHEMQRCQPLLDGKPVTMRLDAPVEVHVPARPELAAIAIENLLRNACQFTEAGQIGIALAPGRLTVDDTGTGVPPAIRERLFDRFVQADTSTGSGLGLAIVRRVADHLGWQVRFEARPQGGSRFMLLWADAP